MAKAITAHEPEAELLSPEDVDQDVASLSAALAEERAERIARNVLLRSDAQQLMEQLLSAGIGRSEEEILLRALRTLAVAVSPVPMEGAVAGRI